MESYLSERSLRRKKREELTPSLSLLCKGTDPGSSVPQQPEGRSPLHCGVALPEADQQGEQEQSPVKLVQVTAWETSGGRGREEQARQEGKRSTRGWIQLPRKAAQLLMLPESLCLCMVTKHRAARQ